MERFWKFKDFDDSLWTNWKWQLQNRLDNASNIKDYFPNINQTDIQTFECYIKKYSFAITPYTLSLVELDEDLNPLFNDPIWNQFRFDQHDGVQGTSCYDGIHENWENPEELPTRMLHHKYPDRAILRLVDCCFGYCNYCYLTSRIMDKKKTKNVAGTKEMWKKTIQYLRNNPQIRDIIISGGDPLMFDNENLERILLDVSSIDSIQSIRLNTRALTFNPFRFDTDLVEIIKKYNVTALEVHFAHPKELSPIVDEKLRLFDEVGYRPLILWRSPLIRGVNDTKEVLQELLLKLYQRRITPYYIFHYAPFTLGRCNRGLSVKRGVHLLSEIRREIPGPAFPKYTLFHIEGKHDIPLEPHGTDNFIYTRDENNRPIIKFKNWKNHWVTYPDIEEMK
ncbi:MAG: radical SAM protein [candidate division WOR-3 bacterium]|nr:radical SAM protein [candidate division WOR-3 bacterium]